MIGLIRLCTVAVVVVVVVVGARRRVAVLSRCRASLFAVSLTGRAFVCDGPFRRRRRRRRRRHRWCCRVEYGDGELIGIGG